MAIGVLGADTVVLGALMALREAGKAPADRFLGGSIREPFAELLATAERRIVCAADGAEARDSMREQDVDLLITDIELPDGSGLGLAREALRQNPALPVIVCSGHDLSDVARSLGPTAHPLRKPFDPDELEALVARLAG